MGNTATAVAAPATESILVTVNSTIEHLQSALIALSSIEGCLFSIGSDQPPAPAREGIEARSAQAADLAYELNDRLQTIYNRL